MAAKIELPRIKEVIRKGNAWSKQIRLRLVDGTPVALDPATLVLMHIRDKRGDDSVIVKTYSSVDASITFDETGLIVFEAWDGADTYDITEDALIGELTIGPNEALLTAYVVFVFELFPAVTIPESVTV